MIKFNVRYAFYFSLREIYYSMFFLAIVLLPLSVKAMKENEEEFGSSSHISSQSKKKVETKESPQEEKFLEGVSETLLIPLYGRALETERHDGFIQDPKAVEIVSKIRKELPTLKLTCSPQLQLGLCIRTQILDERVREFLNTYPDANIVNLGAGLCTRFTRFNNGEHRWTEVDLPQVKKLWHQIYEESENHRFIEGSVTETDWFDEIVTNSDSKTLFIAEGLLMYFPESVVSSIISNIGKRFPGSEILFDVVGIPEFMTSYSDWIFPDLKQSGTKFSWGGNTNTSFEHRDDLSVVGTWPFFERQKTRWKQTTKLTYLYYVPGMGPGPRVIQLRLEDDFATQSDFKETSYYSRMTRKAQNFCYQIMAKTFWDPLMSGFKPGRVIAINALDLEPDDKVLFVGEGSGLDFEVLPENFKKENLQAFDFSPEMVKQAKRKAIRFGIPEENCFIGDAQKLPFTEEKFDKIYFPLSLGSIPDPTLALKEAERVLASKGKVVVMEKLVDDGYEPSYVRQLLNFFTKFLFADINRNLTHIMGENSPLKIVHYQSLANKLSGFFIRRIGSYYRVALLVRDNDYPDTPSCGARLSKEKDD